MSRGNGIIVSADPMGKFMEGYITGTPKPGTVMQIDVSEGVDATGRFTWEAFNKSNDGDRGIIAVLLEDKYQGKLMTTAYAAGDRGFLYVPVAGEELNMLLQDDGSGTSDDHALGEMLMVDDGTGKVMAADSDPQATPFQLLETITDPTADQLVWCMYTGY